MVVEGVHFNEAKIRAMKKKEFLKECMPVVFKDRSEEERKEMLSEIYDRITRG